MTTRVRTIDFLPEIFKTKSNEQFLSATLDQLFQQPNTSRIQGFIGSKFGYGVKSSDKYLVEPSKERTDYQLEPSVVFKKKDTEKAIDILTYNGLIDSLRLAGSEVKNHSLLFQNEYYSWDSFTDLDKLINFSQYYWLPDGPDAVTISSTSIFKNLIFNVKNESTGYFVTSDDVTLGEFNPEIVLIRGGTYEFVVDQDSEFYIQSEPSVTGFAKQRPNVSVRNVLGVTNNGAKQGSVIFNVPFSDDQDSDLYDGNLTVDIVTDQDFTEIYGKLLSTVRDIDGVRELDGKTLMFYGAKPGYKGRISQLFGDSFDSNTFTEPVTLRITDVSASTDVITCESTQSLKINNGIYFNEVVLGNIPADSVLYVKEIISETEFTLSLEPNGDVFDITTDDSGLIFATSQDGLYEDSIISDVNKYFYTIRYIPTSTDNIIVLEETELIPDNTKITALLGAEYISRNFVRSSLGEISLIPENTAKLDKLYYQDGVNANKLGVIRLIDNPDSAPINVLEILTKKAYTSPNNVKFTNGLKVQFAGNIVPESYKEGQYYVEGVGEKIELLDTKLFDIPEIFGESTVRPFDASSFDTFNFNETLFSPVYQDYITIKRNSFDRNGWSRSNRWFHIDVLKSSIENNLVSPISTQALENKDNRAKRPIIEFNTGIKLFNSGTVSKQNVNFINFSINDAFNEVAGQTTFIPDGADSVLYDGASIVFANDTDINVRGKIFIAKFEKLTDTSNPVLTLSIAPNGDVLVNEQISVTQGISSGKVFYFNGNSWNEAQSKTRINQPPLFDVYDANGISFGDTDFYPSSTFKGTTLFEFAVGSGIDDPILGFPVKYSSVNNIGDIQFVNTYQKDDFTFLDGINSASKKVSDGVVPRFSSRDDYTKNLGWQPGVTESFQYQVFDRTATGNSLEIDVRVKTFDETPAVPVVVYVDNTRLLPNEFTITVGDNISVITLLKDYEFNSPVKILAYSNQVSKEAYYQIPLNLDRNPFNNEIVNINLGDIRGHYKSICNNVRDFDGTAFGANNFRDLGNLIPFGTRIIQNSASVVTAGAFLRNNNTNFFDALSFNSNEYQIFKNRLINTLETNEYTNNQNPEEILDDAIAKMSVAKIDTTPFFWSDMLPVKNILATNTISINTILQNGIFKLSKVYNFKEANYSGVLVYLGKTVNSTLVTTQLIKDIDYVISDVENSLTMIKELVPGDQLIIKEYDQTFGSFVPNTPTKLGLYPSFVPEVVLDNTYINPIYFIKGHDGSYTKIYGSFVDGELDDYRDKVLLEFEKRIFNNLKTSNKLPMTYDEVVPGKFRDVGYSFDAYKKMYTSQFLNWVSSNRLDYKNHFYSSTNAFTYNYSGSRYSDNTEVNQGSWRGAYLWLYDTVNPDTKPWEMLGVTSKPNWWDKRYGSAPYTSTNLVLWNDLRDGVVWNDGNPYVIENRKREGLLSMLPVDASGKLLSPFESVLGIYDPKDFSKDWEVLEYGATEFSYLRSSAWPFDLMRLMALTKPVKFFALASNVDNYQYNTDFNQYLLNDQYRNYMSAINYYGEGTAAHSFINWIVDYQYQFGINGTEFAKDLVNSLDVRLTYRVAGFTDKDLVNFYVEKGTPNSNNSSLMIPDESYSILLYDNQPIDLFVYSSVIILRTDKGFRVYGNSQNRTYFISFLPNNNGQFEEISVNRTTVKIAKSYTNETMLYEYGYEFSNLRDLVSFIRGYGLYLASQGAKFNEVENGIELNWDQMITEIIYWVQTGWDIGSTLNVNPAARQLTVDKDNQIIQPLTVNKENFVLNQNLFSIPIKDLYINRVNTEFSIKTLNDGDTIALFKANISTIEHVVVFDNETVFNDVIYNLTTGLRQQRLFVRGTKSAEWNGTLNAGGFIINQDNIQDWEPNVKYNKGMIVRFKNEYYAANKIVVIPSDTFDYESWDKTSFDNIQKGMLPNASTRAYESTLYYNSTSPNLENDSDLLSYSLIGYRPRKYLVDADFDDGTQVNLFKNAIKTKGTVESVSKLQNINLQNNELMYNTFENWAIKNSEFGGLEHFNFIEVTLDESKLTGNPSIVSLISNEEIDGADQSIPLYNIKNFGNPITDTNILNELGQEVEVLPSAGYVNLDDVATFGYNVDSIPDETIDQIYKNDYVFVAEKDSSWQVTTPLSTTALVTRVVNNLNETVTVIFNKPHRLSKNQVLGIVNFDDRVDGYHLISDVVNLTSVIVDLTLASDVSSISGTGLSYLLQNQRVNTSRDIVNLPLLNAEYSVNKVWIDKNKEGKWAVYEKTNNYKQTNFQKIGLFTEKFGSAVAYIPNYGYFIADSSEGKVYFYVKTAQGYILRDTIVNNTTTFQNSSTNFGTAMAYTDDLLIISSPNIRLPNNSIISQIYIYKTPSASEINSIVLQQVITFGGNIGSSVEISDDSNLLFLGSPDNNVVIGFQRDRVVSYTSTGLRLAQSTTVDKKQFTCVGDVRNRIKEGEEITFLTSFTDLNMELSERVSELQNFFRVLGDQREKLSYGDQIAFSNTGPQSTRLYTIGSRSIDPGFSLTVTGATGNGVTSTLTYATQSSIRFAVGSIITVSGMTPAGYNGTWVVTASTTNSVSFSNSTFSPMVTAGTITKPESTTFNIIEYFEVGLSIPARTKVYKVQFDESVKYTVITSTFDSTTNRTTFVTVEPIEYTAPSNSYIYAITDTFSVAGILSTPLVSTGDKYGFSLATNNDGSKLFVGAPYTNYNNLLQDTGAVYVWDRLIQNVEVQYDQIPTQAFVILLPFNPTNQTRIYVNDRLLQSNKYVVILNGILFGNIGLRAGDIITVSSLNFVNTSQLFSQDNISDLRQGELFGYALDCNRFGTELLVGCPFDTVNDSSNQGSVYRFTNAGKRFGRINGVIGTNLIEPTYAFLNGQTVNLFDTIPLLSTVSQGSTSCFVQPELAFRMPTNGIVTIRDNLNNVERTIAYDSRNPQTGEVVFAVPFPFTNTFIPTNGFVIVPLGSAANVANAINKANISNIRAFSTEDNRLQIFLLLNDLGQSNNKLNISVFNGNVLFQLGFIDYVKSQVIRDPHEQTTTQFGAAIKFNENNSFVVGAPLSTRYSPSFFDLIDDTNIHNDTVFDYNLTTFEDRIRNAGSVYMYDYIDVYEESFTNIGNYIYAQSCNDTAQEFGATPMYGSSIAFNNNVVVVGSPDFQDGSNKGTILIFENETKQPNWHEYRVQSSIVDVSKIQKVQLYDNKSNETLISLDYLDPLSGKLLGVVRQNLDFISATDPAGYNSNGFSVGSRVWSSTHLGELWFDTSRTKFINYHQNDVVYNSKHWGSVLPGSEVSVYTWVESDVLPIFYEGPGTPYDFEKYSVVQGLDNNSNLVPKYYYWVRNTNTVSSNKEKTLSDSVLESYISDPKNSGVPFFAPIRPNVYALYQCKEFTNDTSTNLHLGFNKGTADNPGHQEFQLIRENYPSDFLTGFPDNNKGYFNPMGLYDRLLDSLSGADETGAPVPDYTLPKMLQQGVSVRPRQSFFINRLNALRNYLEYTNNVVKQYPILEFNNITFLYSRDALTDTTKFWKKINWWAEGFDDSVRASQSVDLYSQLTTLTNVSENTIVSVEKNSNGNKEFYQYVNDTWVRIGLVDGTIEFLSTLWDNKNNNIGFGSAFYDNEGFDFYPQVETRAIVRAINEQIFVNELFEHRNKSLILLFEYIQSENVESQNYMPWLTKTSLVDVNYTVRELEQNERYQRDNESLLEGYINEFKPYHVVLKQFSLGYTKTEEYKGNITDFDLPPVYNDEVGKFISPQITTESGYNGPYVFSVDSSIWENTEYTQWIKNFGLKLLPASNVQVATLSKFLSTIDREIFVDDSQSFPVTGLIKIGEELIGYTEIDREQKILRGLSRGVDNTPISANFAGVPIIMDLPAVTVTHTGRSYDERPSVTAYVNTNLYPAPTKPAVLRAIMAGDKVVGVRVVDPGEGYIVAPDIIFDSTDEVSSSFTQINFLNNTVQVQTEFFDTGDLIYSKGLTSNGNTILPDGYYYIRSNGDLGQNIKLISFYQTRQDSISGKNRLRFLQQDIIEPSYVHTIGIRARAIANLRNEVVRSVTPILKFDRTSYRAKISPWVPGKYYSSPYISVGNDTSSNAKLYISADYTNLQGVVTPSGGTSAVFDVANVLFGQEYIVTIVNNGVNYQVNDTIVISGLNLGGVSPENDCIITVQTIGDNGEILSIEVTGKGANASLASLQGAVLPITSVNSVQGNAVVTVDYSYSGLKPGQINNAYVYFFEQPTLANQGIFIYDDTMNNGAKIRISRPSFNPESLSTLYNILILDPGSIYDDGDTIVIPGTNLGGQNIINDAIITVTYANTDGSIFSATVKGISANNFSRYYVKPTSNIELGLYVDAKMNLPVSFSSINWGDINTMFGYIPEPIQNNSSFNYVQDSIVTYAGIIWQCIDANNDNEFNPTRWFPLQSDDLALNALDRIEAYYNPTYDMPGKDPEQLLTGVSYPDTVYFGNKFAPEDQFPLDMVLQDQPFYPADANVKAIVSHQGRVVAACDSKTNSFVIIRNELGTWNSYPLSNAVLDISDIKVYDGLYVITTRTRATPVLLSYDATEWVSVGDSPSFDIYPYDIGGYNFGGVNIPLTSLNQVYVDNGLYIAVGEQILHSVDAIEWVSAFDLQSNLENSFNGITYANTSAFAGYISVGKGFAVVSGNNTAAPNIQLVSRIATSSSGLPGSWTLQQPRLTTHGLNDVAASQSVIVVVGDTNQIWYSTNASNWIRGSVIGANNANINSVEFGNGKFIAVGNKVGDDATDPAYILVSNDGMLWQDVSSIFITTQNLNDIYFDGEYFYATGENDTILKTTNGINWQNASNIQVADPYYIVKGNQFLYGYGPEELVPGVVSDTLSMYVKTSPGAYWDLDDDVPFWYGYTGFNMKSVVATPDQVTNKISFKHLVANPISVSVFIMNGSFGTRIYENITTLNNPISYTVDWLNKEIQVHGYNTGSIMVEAYELGNAKELYRGNTETYPLYVDEVTGNSMFVFEKIETLYPITDVVIYANGEKLEKGTVGDQKDFYVDDSQPNDTRVIFTSFYDAKVDYLVFSIILDSSTTFSSVQYNYSVPSTLVIVPANTTDTLSIDDQLVSLSGDNIQNMIVEVNGLRVDSFTIDDLSLTVTLPFNVTPDDIVAVTTFNDTSRQYLKTSSFNSIKTSSIDFVNLVRTNATITFNVDPEFNDGDEVYISHVLGTIELNNNFYYVKNVSSDIADSNYHYELYIDDALTLPIFSNNLSTYSAGGYIRLTSSFITVPSYTVPITKNVLVYSDNQRTWLTVNGKRLISEKVQFVNDFNFIGNIQETTLTIDKVINGSLRVGQTITGTNIAPNTQIVAFLTGLGNEGTYTVNTNQIVATTTIKVSFDNTLVINDSVTDTDDIIITNMVNGASPNEMTYNLTVSKNNQPTVTRTNLNDRTWLVKDFYSLDSEIHVFNAKSLLEIRTENVIVASYLDKLISFVSVTLTEIKNVQAYNKNTLEVVEVESYQLVDGKAAIVFSGGVSLNDQIELSIGLGSVIEINGERISFQEVDVENNVIRKLVRGVQGTIIRPLHPINSFVYSFSNLRQITSDDYNLVWNTTSITSKGDPLQISTTDTAKFLQIEQNLIR
jgi:hypothetical protein